MADYTSSNTGAVIDAAVDYVEILDNYLTISSNELIITGQTGVGSDTVLLNLKANNSAGFAGNVLRFTDTDPTAVNNGSMGKIQWFSTTTGAVVAEINGKNDDTTPDGQLIISTAAGASLTQRIDINADGDIQFFNAAGTSRDLHWDATDSRLGINVTTPTEALDVLGNANFTGTVTADGLTVDGNATISVSDNSDNLTLVSTDTDANAGPNLLFKRDNNSAAGDDLMGSIVFQGEDAGNNLTDYVAFKTQIQDPTGGSEDGRLKIELMSGGTSRSLLDASGSNAIVFNEDGQALNFRVESSGNANMLFVDGTNNRVGIGTSSPQADLHLGAASPHIDIGPSTGNRGKVGFDSNNVYIGSTSGTGEIHFKNNIGSTDAPHSSGDTKMVITDSGVGIGTSPAAGNTLDISSGDGTIRVTQELDVATAGLNLIGASNQGALGRITIWQNATSAQGGYIKFDTCPSGTNTFTERMRIGPTGIIYVNGDGTGGRISGDGSGGLNLQDGNGRQTFKIMSPASGSAQAMTLDASSNLLIGKTALDNTTAGTRINSDGSASFVKNGNLLYLNRNTTDGDIVTFAQDNTAVGSIGVNDDKIIFGTANAAIAIDQSSNIILPYNPATPGARDAAIDLGYASGRFKNLYLSGGVYVGGTGAANYLDDYEEGTFTAAISCGSGTITLESSANLLSYTKIGRLVHIQGGLNADSVSSPSGDFRITGLPFAMDPSIGEGADISAGSAALYNMASDVSGLINTEVSMVGANATILIRDGGGTAAGVNNIANKFDGDSIVRLSITYHTTS